VTAHKQFGVAKAGNSWGPVFYSMLQMISAAPAVRFYTVKCDLCGTFSPFILPHLKYSQMKKEELNPCKVHTIYKDT